MAVKMVYLITLSLRWRLALSAHDSNKTAKMKTIMAVECAVELSNWLKESRASIRVLVCLYPTSFSLQ